MLKSSGPGGETSVGQTATSGLAVAEAFHQDIIIAMPYCSQSSIHAWTKVQTGMTLARNGVIKMH